MSARLTAFDGALNGLDVLHGLVVVRSSNPQQSGGTSANKDTKLSLTAQRSDLEAILQRATEVTGTRQEAMRWMGTPVRALNYATPVSLLADESGTERVLAVLTNLENGVL
jgi:hypothetical protein